MTLNLLPGFFSTAVPQSQKVHRSRSVSLATSFATNLVGVKDCAGVLHLQDFQSVRAALSGAQPFEFKPGCWAKKGVLGFVAHLIPNKVMKVHTSYVG